jgi:hypothetical protein
MEMPMQQDKQTAPLRCEFIYHNGDGSEKDRCDNRAEKGNIACKLHAAPAAIEQARPQTPERSIAEAMGSNGLTGEEWKPSAAAEPAPERTQKQAETELMESLADFVMGYRIADLLPDLPLRLWNDGVGTVASQFLDPQDNRSVIEAVNKYARAVAVPESAAGQPFNNQRINERVQEWEKAHRVPEPAAQQESDVCAACGYKVSNHKQALWCPYGAAKFTARQAEPASTPSRAEDSIQKRVTDWAIRCFGEEHVFDPQVRGMRLLEEAIEFAQSVNVPTDKCKAIVDYVYSRPAGTPKQELGGVAITAIAAATAIQENFFGVTMTELTRIEAKSPEHFTARNQTKIDLGFAAEASALGAKESEK